MLEKFQTKESRRLFCIVILLLLFGLFAVEYFLLPWCFDLPIAISKTVLISIVDKLLISVLVATVISLFTFWIAPSDKHKAQVTILQAGEIGEQLIEARIDTEKWWYSGSTGRYTRNQTLPYFADESFL